MTHDDTGEPWLSARIDIVSGWGDQDVVDDALKIICDDLGGKMLLGPVTVKGPCEKCGDLIIDVFDDHTASELAEGTALHARLVELVERPIEINRAI
jgi:hypothetical protein